MQQKQSAKVMIINKKRARNGKILTIIKATVIVFIIVGISIGGLNAVFGNSENIPFKERIRWIYLMYENVFRTIIVIFSSYLSYSILKDRKKVPKMRRTSLLSFSIFMVIMFVITPLITGINEISIALMPFPWSSMPIQLLKDGYFFSNHIESNMITIILGIYIVYQLVILIGTLIYGRRFHCSMICPFSGCHAESFSLALPLINMKNKDNPLKRWKRNTLLVFKWSMFGFSILIISLMAVDVFYNKVILPFSVLRNLEMIKYLIFEIFFFQLFYFTFTGRGYCYYCPAGTLLGIVAKLSGQQIETNLSECISCKLCDKECEMSIEISSKAIKGISVENFDCVGCGHCVDICPKNNLYYSTTFTRLLKKLMKKVNKKHYSSFQL